MKKTTFKQKLFNPKVRKTALAVGLVGGTAFLPTAIHLEAKHQQNLYQAESKNNVVTEIIRQILHANQEPERVPTAEEIEQEKLIAALREIVSKMDLTAEEIDQLCNDYDLPLAIFIQTGEQAISADERTK